MKKLLALSTVIAMLVGCAAAPDNSALMARKEAVAAVSKVEIFYNGQDELAVIDRGGSSMTGMAGLFGPVGMLMALGADAGSKLTMAERAEARSKAFTAAVDQGTSPRTLNQQFAESLASRIRATGREVRLTPTKRISGDLSKSTFPETQFTAGYTPLVVRITTGYGASDAMSMYRPIIVVEQSLKNGDPTRVHQNIYRSQRDEPSYMRYDSLLEQHAAAHEGLRQGLAAAVDPVYQRMFMPGTASAN